MSISGVTPSRIVGPTYEPLGSPAASRPSSTTFAPEISPRSIHSRIRSRAAHEITGPDVAALVQPVADPQRARGLDQGRHQLLVRVADGHDDRPGHAPLPGGAERRPDDPLDGLVDHRVGHHDHVVLGATERLHALARLGRALVDDPRHRRRADERHRVDPRMIEDPLDDLAAPVDEVHDAGRQARARAAPRTRAAASAAPARTASGRTCCRTRSRTGGTRTGPSPGS